MYEKRGAGDLSMTDDCLGAVAKSRIQLQYGLLKKCQEYSELSNSKSLEGLAFLADRVDDIIYLPRI